MSAFGSLTGSLCLCSDCWKSVLFTVTILCVPCVMRSSSSCKELLLGFTSVVTRLGGRTERFCNLA